MGLEYYFKANLDGIKIEEQAKVIVENLGNTRLAMHYTAVENAVEGCDDGVILMLLSLLIFSDDKTYRDVLHFCEVYQLEAMLDYFKTVVDLEILSDFMRDLEPPRKKVFVGESEIIDVDASIKIGEQHVSPPEMDHRDQTLLFGDNQDKPVLDMAHDGDTTRSNEDNVDVSHISHFFERPTILDQFTWTPNGNFDSAANYADIAPWAVYLQTSAVASKVENFRFFRAAGMRLQFRINGSPFHYGRLYAGYCANPYEPLPYGGMEEPGNQVIVPTNYGAFNASTAPLKTHYSQWPGVFIDPSTNMTSTLDIPFFWPQNYCSLNSSTDVESLGFLRIWVLTPLRHANGATNPATLTVTGHLIDPVFTMPTFQPPFTGEAGKAGTGSTVSAPSRTRRNKKSSNNTVVTNNTNKARQEQAEKPKSTPKNDEYGKGIVSAPASALANFAGTLEKVPIIGNYATATKIAAGAVARIAKLFGYSRPCIITEPTNVHIKGNSSLAISESGDNSQKLTLDPKQEICVDPTVTGLQGHDEMAFAHLFKRESLLLELPWPITTTAGAALCHIAVGPWNKPINASVGAEWNTALSWASQPFQYWRGSLKYRFQIVASQMHRGRLAIVYNSQVPANGGVLPAQVTTHQYFMDLTECRDMTVVVRHGHYNPWLLNGPVPVPFIQTGTTNFDPTVRCRMNGVLSVYVLNELVAPTNTADINVNIFISAGDDFMVAAPGNDIYRLTPFAVEIRDSYQGGALQAIEEGNEAKEEIPFVGESSMADYQATSELMPVNTAAVVINGSEDDTPDVDDIETVFFGEQIVSLRALLKRYSFYTTFFPTAAEETGLVTFQVFHGSVPMYRGTFGTTGNDNINQLDVAAVNLVNTNLLTWYMPGYLAHRGAIRWKYLWKGHAGTHLATNMTVTRNTTPRNNNVRYGQRFVSNSAGAAVADTQASKTRAYLNNQISVEANGHSGSAMQWQRIGSGIEFEHPYYSSQRFTFLKRPTVDTADGASAAGILNFQAQVITRDAHIVDTKIQASQVNTTLNALETWVAAGEDFSLHYFIGAPVMGFQSLV